MKRRSTKVPKMGGPLHDPDNQIGEEIDNSVDRDLPRTMETVTLSPEDWAVLRKIIESPPNKELSRAAKRWKDKQDCLSAYVGAMETPRGKRLKKLRDKVVASGAPLASLDEINRGPAPKGHVQYPVRAWRKITDPALGRGARRDVWLYYPKRAHYVTLWHNWFGFSGDIAEVRKEGATHWCEAVKPLPPNT